MKVVELNADKPCPYCAAKPSCPDFTCPRIASVWHCESTDEWEVAFHESWQKPEPPAA